MELEVTASEDGCARKVSHLVGWLGYWVELENLDESSTFDAGANKFLGFVMSFGVRGFGFWFLFSRLI